MIYEDLLKNLNFPNYEIFDEMDKAYKNPIAYLKSCIW